MNEAPPPPWAAALADLVADRLGLHFPARRASDLLRGFRSAAQEFGFAEPEACARWLLSAPHESRQVEILARHLTIGETYFHRDRRAFELIETEVLPALARRRTPAEPLRCWSAGCCTGEEAYSLAISARRVLGPDRPVRILGTDVNRHFLRAAGQAVFGEWSFRESPPGLRETFFQPLDRARWRLNTPIRATVRFAPLNLAGDIYPHPANGTADLDLILCRNVLIYFTPDRAAAVIRALARCLAPGGWLILGPTETTHAELAGLTPVRFSGGVFFRRPETAGTAPDGVAADRPALFAEPAPIAPGDLPDAAETAAPPGAPAPEAAAPSPLALARLHADQGRLVEALSVCERALAADKTAPPAHQLRAEILQELGRSAEASESFTRAIYLQPDFVPAHLALGHLALARGRPREARRHFANTLALVRRRPPDEIVPGTDGLTAGRIAGIVTRLRARPALPA